MKSTDPVDRVTSPPPAPEGDPVAVPWDHVAQIYDSEAVLCRSVASFLHDGLIAAEPLVVISTRPHRDAVAEAMSALGSSWTDAARSGRLCWLDARETLEKVMIGRIPDPQRFDTYVGGTVRTCLHAGGGRRVRAFGEMVDLLWREGHPDAALHLEDLWNGLGRVLDVALLCAYSRGNLYREASGRRVSEVCERHARVIAAGDGEPILATG